MDFIDLTKIMLEIAAGTHSSGRLVSVPEGGYNLSGLEASVGAPPKALTAF
jgi:acetoin utilization deacetylase AcuC-like enzyme